MYKYKYCPFCGKTELVRVGRSSTGAILRCVSCKKEFIVFSCKFWRMKRDAKLEKISGVHLLVSSS